MTPPNVLLIGPSHGSSRYAGLETEQKILTVHGCNSWAAITELTVTTSHPESESISTPPSFVKKQIDACMKTNPVSVIKAGGISSVELFHVILETVQEYKDATLILELRGSLKPEAINFLRKELLPLTTLVYTRDEPILDPLFDPGDAILNSRSSHSESQKPLCKRPEIVLVHNDIKGDFVRYFKPSDEIMYESSLLEELPEVSYEGISLVSAAITASKAKGISIAEAIPDAFMFAAASCSAGDFRHPNILHSTYRLQFAPGGFVSYLLQRADVKEAWKRHTEHKFLTQLADGTLPLEAFKYYLIQDYLFLVQFARANSLAAYKVKDLEKIVRPSEIVLHINREMALHLGYCQEFGLSKEDILKVPESQACTAYTRYVLDIGSSEDWFALQVALSPCFIGYGVIARPLYEDPETVRQGNRYWKWIENHVADDYTEAVNLGRALLGKHAQKQSPSRIEELVAIFIHATNMETGFWDMGYEKI